MLPSPIKNLQKAHTALFQRRTATVRVLAMTSIPSVSGGLIERATSEWEPMEIQQR